LVYRMTSKTMTNKIYNENAMTKCTKTNLFLNACVAVLFVSTLTTCGVEGNQFAVEEEPLELSVDEWNRINHLLLGGQDDQNDSLDDQHHSFYEGSSDIELPTDTTIESNDVAHDEGDEDKALTEKRAIPRMYKKSAIPRMYKKSAIPRMYKKSAIPRMYRRSGSVPRLYKRSEFGVPRMYKRDGENADVGTYEIYRRDQMPRLYKKSGVDAESDEGSNDVQWLRQVRNSALPRLYKKSIPRMYKKSSIPRMYKKSDYLAAVRLGRSMTPRLYKKSYFHFQKKMIPRLYKRDSMPRLY